MITKDDITEIDESLYTSELRFDHYNEDGEPEHKEAVVRYCSLSSVIDVIDLVVTTIQDARVRGFKTNRVVFSRGAKEIRQTMYQRFFISEHESQHLKVEGIRRACRALHDLNLIRVQEKKEVVCLVLSERLEYLVSGEHHEDL